MKELFGSILGGIFDGPAIEPKPTIYQERRFSEREMAHMAAGGSVRYLGHTWYDASGGTTSVRSGPFFSLSEAEEGEREMGGSIARIGYRPPRWYEFWRWKECRISENMMQGYRAAKAEP